MAPLPSPGRDRHAVLRHSRVEEWQRLAIDAGLKGIYFIGINHKTQNWSPKSNGFDGAVANHLPDTRPWISRGEPLKWLRYKLQSWLKYPTIHRYKEVLSDPVMDKTPDGDCYPTVIPNWDTTARHGVRGNVIEGSTPALFGEQVRKAVELLSDRPLDKRVIIVKSWNEWAEGNYLEPDQVHGHQYLSALRDQIVEK